MKPSGGLVWREKKRTLDKVVGGDLFEWWYLSRVVKGRRKPVLAWENIGTEENKPTSPRQEEPRDFDLNRGWLVGDEMRSKAGATPVKTYQL